MADAWSDDVTRCAGCGYDVSGVPAGEEAEPTCPECGHVGVWRPHMRLRPTMGQRWRSLGLGLIPGVICTGTVAVGHGVDATDLVFLGALGMPPFVLLGLVLFARRTDPRLVPGVVIGSGAPAVLVTLFAWFVLDPLLDPVVALFTMAMYWIVCPIAGGVLGAEVARGMLGID